MKKLWVGFSGIAGKIPTIGMVLAGICLSFMAIIITLEIILRAFFGFSLLITDELSGYILVFITYIGIAYSLKTGGQVRISILYDRYTNKLRPWIDIVIYIITIWFTVNLLLSCWDYAIDSFNRERISSGLMRAPLFIPQSFIVIGLGMLILQLIVGLGKAVEKILLQKRGDM